MQGPQYSEVSPPLVADQGRAVPISHNFFQNFRRGLAPSVGPKVPSAHRSPTETSALEVIAFQHASQADSDLRRDLAQTWLRWARSGGG
jgi:hypothetical protein